MFIDNYHNTIIKLASLAKTSKSRKNNKLSYLAKKQAT